MTGRIILGTFIIIAVGFFIAIEFDVEKVPPPPEKLKQNIEVFLPQRIDNNTDRWMRYDDGTLSTYKSIEEGTIKIHLPSERILDYKVAYGNLSQTNETLDTINLNLPPGMSDYQDAINSLEKELERLAINESHECVSGLNKLREEKIQIDTVLYMSVAL